MAAAIAANSAFTVSAEQKYGWQGIAGASPYYMKNDAYATGMIVIDGIVYVFDSNGECTGKYTGFGNKNGRRRYYQNGSLYTNGWLDLPSGTYYIYPDGSIAEGIASIDGKQYNFSSSGKLITSSSREAFSITADKKSVYLGTGDVISFTITANNISNTAAVGNSILLQRYDNGSWYSVTPGMLGSLLAEETLSTINVIGNVGTPDQYRSSHTIAFKPDYYVSGLKEGRYRAAVNVMTDNGITSLYQEFDMIEPVSVSTPSPVYYLNTTEKIYFTSVLNTNAMVYGPEIYDLYYYDNSGKGWVKQEPQSGKDIITVPHMAPAGNVISTYLDLTRYSRASMKSGKYRAVIGDNITCEFELKKPFEAEITEIPSSNQKIRQAAVTVTNTNPYDIKVNGYGELLKYENGKWKTIPLIKGKKLDTSLEIPSKRYVTKTMTLTDYYPYTSLKKGNYCMKLPAENGGYIYAYFTLS